MKILSLASLAVAICATSSLSRAQNDSPALAAGTQTDGPFRKVIIDADQNRVDTLKDPMELAVATDGRVFYAERDGAVKMWRPTTKKTVVVGKLKVEDYVAAGLEDGLLGITLDPHFTENGFLYLYYSPPEMKRDAQGKKAGENVLSRFTLNGDTLDLASEKIMLRVATQREQCCQPRPDQDGCGGEITSCLCA